MSKGLVLYVHGFQFKPWSKHKGGVPGTLKKEGAYPSDEVRCYRWDSKGLLSPKYWGAAVNKAIKQGPKLAAHIERRKTKYAFIDLIGFSLGTRVVYQALKDIAPGAVRNVYLFGGALPARFSWWRASQRIGGRIVNFSSHHDNILLGYQANLRSGRSIGRPSTAKGSRNKGIHTYLRAVTNIDVSKLVAGHLKYNPVLHQLLRLAAEHPTEAQSHSYGDWRDEFHWDPALRPFTHPKSQRGAQTEIIQRALHEPLDGGARLLQADAVDGIPGPNTRAAVYLYQKRKGLRMDGVVGNDTWRALVHAD